MKRKLLTILAILVVLLIIGGIIFNLENKNSEEKLYVTILNNKSINCFVVQYKSDSVKITDKDDIKLISEMFEENVKRNKSLDDQIGWIYAITPIDKDGNELKTFMIIDDTTISINDKTYTCENLDIKKLDELTGIHRE